MNTMTIDEDTIEEIVLTIDEYTVEEILLRLPVKSLIRYRCVCKKWRDLIDSSAFIKSHLTLSSKRDDPPILFKYFDEDLEVPKNIVSCYDNYESFAEFRALDFDLPPYFSVGDFACCTHSNGVVCLSDYWNVILFNPALREFKTIPLCPFRCSNPWGCSDCCHLIAYGFGFDAAINDFKVVKLMYSMKHIEAQVYDLSTNCWRKSDRILINVDYSNDTGLPVLLNGILHYIVKCWLVNEERRSKSVILTFNISTELFETMEFPSHCCVETDIESCIFMADESTLALVAFTYPFRTSYQLPMDPPKFTCVQLDVWLMKEYGVRESWTKQYSIMSPDSSRVGRPLSFVKKDKLLFITAYGKLICYDLPTGQQRQLRQYQFQPYSGCEDLFYTLLYSFGVVICNESLVSIKN